MEKLQMYGIGLQRSGHQDHVLNVNQHMSDIESLMEKDVMLVEKRWELYHELHTM